SMADAVRTGWLRRRALRLSPVARASLLIAALFAVDKPLDLFRQILIGRQFGVGAELDAFNAANNLPDLLRALITGGALSLALIPVLSEVLQRDGRPASWLLFSRVANLAFAVTAVLTVLVAVFAETIVSAPWGIAPGFSPENRRLVADLMRLNLLALLLFSVSGLLTSGLQAHQHFFLPALAPVVYDLGQIAGALILAPAAGLTIAGVRLPAFGLGVHGLVYGVIVGAALHLAVQLPGLPRFAFRWSPVVHWRDPGVLQVVALMGPRLVTIGVFQLMFVMQDNLASRLEAGAVTALTYGWLIMQFPETLIGTALGTAMLPTLSEQFGRGDEAAFSASVTRALRVLLALTLPAGALVAVTVQPLVAAAFAFGEAGTTLVTVATRGFLIGLVGHAWLEVLARAWFARLRARPPLVARLINVAIFLGLGLALFRPMGAFGIALANSLGFTAEAGVLYLTLRRVLPSIDRSWSTLPRAAVASILAGGLAYAAIAWLPLGPMAAAFIGAVLGAGAGALFLLPEIRDLARL
ncbi:MAG TPA: murein biosynthesis integral membrane protein MurJ, partial [Anaerolineales bacterium]|nr:murein biosynthesis integral membrane protein MurJ [Anaerolineales bacterium]